MVEQNTLLLNDLNALSISGLPFSESLARDAQCYNMYNIFHPVHNVRIINSLSLHIDGADGTINRQAAGAI
jgi:hypothetical protein